MGCQSITVHRTHTHFPHSFALIGAFYSRQSMYQHVFEENREPIGNTCGMVCNAMQGSVFQISISYLYSDLNLQWVWPKPKRYFFFHFLYHYYQKPCKTQSQKALWCGISACESSATSLKFMIRLSCFFNADCFLIPLIQLQYYISVCTYMSAIFSNELVGILRILNNSCFYS